MSDRGVTAKENEASLCDDENVRKLTMVMAAQLCDYSKTYRIVHFKWANCMAYELYLNKGVLKNYMHSPGVDGGGRQCQLLKPSSLRS